MPAPVARCSKNGLACEQRRAAQRAGDMFYSSHMHGWVFPAEFRAVPRALRDRHVMPYTWTHCPFCNGELPDEVTALRRILDEPPPAPTWQADGDGEEGD
jgi:hypothetical protein